VTFRIPEGVREAIGIRLNRLSEECNEVLRTGAVIGREFGFQLLGALNQDISDDALLDLVEEAISVGTIRELPDSVDRYEFTHALIQQTLADELSTTRRVRLHARIAERWRFCTETMPNLTQANLRTTSPKPRRCSVPKK